MFYFHLEKANIYAVSWSFPHDGKMATAFTDISNVCVTYTEGEREGGNEERQRQLYLSHLSETQKPSSKPSKDVSLKPITPS